MARDAGYEGLFFAGIKTTGIYCRPTCSARKPKAENCEFFSDQAAARAAGYRPCLRCQPDALPGASALIETLVAAIEQQPQKRWREEDLTALGWDASTVRRQFKKRFGMTFLAYARQHRLGLAHQDIQHGKPVIEAQLDAGFESASGFRDAFNRLFNTAPAKGQRALLYASLLDTPLGPMLAIADDKALHLLEFTDRKGLETELKKLQTKTRCTLIQTTTIQSTSAPLQQLKKELADYFAGTLKQFTVPLHLHGTDFQQAVWQQLLTIPYGETRSYAAQAKLLNKPQAVRAVARANGCNQLAVIIPCHRVVGSDGKLTGYSGGLARKEWLLEHEVKTVGRLTSDV